MPFARRILLCAVLLAATFNGIQIARGGLLGSSVHWQYYAFGAAYGDGGSFVVNGSIGGTFANNGDPDAVYFDIVADDTSIWFDYSPLSEIVTSPWSDSELSLPPTIHNGIAINIVEGPNCREISLSPETNMVGFDNSRFSFTNDQLQVDWAGLEFSSSTLVKFDVVTVPEPSALPLLALGAAGIVAFRRRCFPVVDR